MVLNASRLLRARSRLCFGTKAAAPCVWFVTYGWGGASPWYAATCFAPHIGHNGAARWVFEKGKKRWPRRRQSNPTGSIRNRRPSGLLSQTNLPRRQRPSWIRLRPILTNRTAARTRSRPKIEPEPEPQPEPEPEVEPRPARFSPFRRHRRQRRSAADRTSYELPACSSDLPGEFRPSSR